MAHKTGEAKRTVLQFIKFNVVGVLNTAVDFVVFWLLNTLLGTAAYIAQVVSYSCGILNSYLWNSNWTFREQRTRSFREIALFLAVNLVSLGVSLGAMWLCRNVLGMTNEWAAGFLPASLTRWIQGDTIAKLVATVFSVAVNFVGNRLFVFNGKQPPAPAAPAGDGAELAEKAEEAEEATPTDKEA